MVVNILLLAPRDFNLSRLDGSVIGLGFEVKQKFSYQLHVASHPMPPPTGHSKRQRLPRVWQTLCGTNICIFGHRIYGNYLKLIPPAASVNEAITARAPSLARPAPRLYIFCHNGVVGGGPPVEGLRLYPMNLTWVMPA